MSEVKLEDLDAKDRAKLFSQAKRVAAEEDRTMIFKCPGVLHPDGTRTECEYRGFTLADVCPEHGVSVG